MFRNAYYRQLRLAVRLRVDLPSLEKIRLGEASLNGNREVTGKDVPGLLSSLRNTSCMIKGVVSCQE